MQRTIIAVADASRARVFTLDRNDDGGGVRETLSERTDLVNPARRRTPAQLFSDTRTNTNRTGGRFYGVDDHRDAHMDGIDAAFARDIAAAATQALRVTGATRMIVCAAPRMLGFLRDTELGGEATVVDELAHDYVKKTPLQLRELLAEHELLPAPPRS
jgi:protein required for attachment to host cells